MLLIGIFLFIFKNIESLLLVNGMMILKVLLMMSKIVANSFNFSFFITALLVMLISRETKFYAKFPKFNFVLPATIFI